MHRRFKKKSVNPPFFAPLVLLLIEGMSVREFLEQPDYC